MNDPAGHRTAIGLGSNVGDRLKRLRAAARALDDLLVGLRCSAVYETAPMHVVDQPPFLNASCVGCTTLSPADLLARLVEIERAGGRDRAGVRYGPRTIDLDILLYDDELVSSPSLTIPHPRMHERAFVLVPLADVAPNWQHNGLGRSIVQLRRDVDASGVRPTSWTLPDSGEDPESLCNRPPGDTC